MLVAAGPGIWSNRSPGAINGIEWGPMACMARKIKAAIINTNSLLLGTSSSADALSPVVVKFPSASSM